MITHQDRITENNVHDEENYSQEGRSDVAPAAEAGISVSTTQDAADECCQCMTDN